MSGQRRGLAGELVLRESERRDGGALPCTKGAKRCGMQRHSINLSEQDASGDNSAKRDPVSALETERTALVDAGGAGELERPSLYHYTEGSLSGKVPRNIAVSEYQPEPRGISQRPLCVARIRHPIPLKSRTCVPCSLRWDPRAAVELLPQVSSSVTLVAVHRLNRYHVEVAALLAVCAVLSFVLMFLGVGLLIYNFGEVGFGEISGALVLALGGITLPFLCVFAGKLLLVRRLTALAEQLSKEEEFLSNGVRWVVVSSSLRILLLSPRLLLETGRSGAR